MKTTLLIALSLLAVGFAFVPSAEAAECEQPPLDPDAIVSEAIECAHETEHAVLCLVDKAYCLE